MLNQPLRLASVPHAGHEVVGVDGVEAAAWQLQRDSWLKFEVTHREPSSSGGNRPSFIPAPTFHQRRSGYVFKTDSMGTGYYVDTKAVKVIFHRQELVSSHQIVKALFFHSVQGLL